MYSFYNYRIDATETRVWIQNPGSSSNRWNKVSDYNVVFSRAVIYVVLYCILVYVCVHMWQGWLNVVQQLLFRNAYIDMQDSNGVTALMKVRPVTLSASSKFNLVVLIWTCLNNVNSEQPWISGQCRFAVSGLPPGMICRQIWLHWDSSRIN